MNNIDEAINEIMYYIDDIKAENMKQKKILVILKGLIEIIPNNATDTKSSLNIRIKPLHIISDTTLLIIKEWLENEK